MTMVTTLMLLGGGVLFASIVASTLSSRFGIPLLLVFLVVGVMVGERELFGADLDPEFALMVGTLALAVILLDGGLRTPRKSLRVALWPALLLATVGVLLTALLVAVFAVAFGLDWPLALLLGAVLSSTDAAAVLTLLRQTGVSLNDRVGATLEVESAINDPVAVFLTVTLTGMLMAGGFPGWPALTTSILMQFGIGALGGVVAGRLLARALDSLLLVEGLYALLLVSGAVAAFALISLVGGSGFLAVFLIGFLAAQRDSPNLPHVLRITDGFAWLAQAVMFLLLGMLVGIEQLLAHIGLGVGLALVLIFVARPLAVWACLRFFGFPGREIAYVGWVGLRGAVPIVLALFPLLAGVPQAELLFELTFIAVVASLLIQGTTVKLAARWAGVEIPRSPEPRLQADLLVRGDRQWRFIECEVGAEARAVGMRLGRLLDRVGVQTLSVFRDGAPVATDPQLQLAAGDILCLIATPAQIAELLDHTAAEPRRGRFSRKRFFGQFELGGRARYTELAELYGLPLSGDEGDLSLNELMQQRLSAAPVVGDSLRLGDLRLTVLRMEGDEITKVGLKLRGNDGAH